MDCYVFKFKQRNLNDISSKYLSEIYNDGPKFDLQLISSDKTVINAHTLVMAMFSEFIQEYLNEFKPTKNKICGKWIFDIDEIFPNKMLISKWQLFSSIARFVDICIAAYSWFDL